MATSIGEERKISAAVVVQTNKIFIENNELIEGNWG